MNPDTIINTNIVKHVLEGWADNFVEDVPAIHRDGQYLIEYDTLVEHLNNLSNDDLVNIMFEADARYAGE